MGSLRKFYLAVKISYDIIEKFSKKNDFFQKIFFSKSISSYGFGSDKAGSYLIKSCILLIKSRKPIFSIFFPCLIFLNKSKNTYFKVFFKKIKTNDGHLLKQYLSPILDLCLYCQFQLNFSFQFLIYFSSIENHNYYKTLELRWTSIKCDCKKCQNFCPTQMGYDPISL